MVKLSEARRRALFTQWDLALKIGRNQPEISLFEKGYAIPSEEEKRRIAKALKVKPNKIEWPPER